MWQDETVWIADEIGKDVSWNRLYLGSEFLYRGRQKENTILPVKPFQSDTTEPIFASNRSSLTEISSFDMKESNKNILWQN